MFQQSATTIGDSDTGPELTRKITRLANQLTSVTKERFMAPVQDILAAFFERNMMMLHTLAKQVNDGQVAKMLNEEWAAAVLDVWQTWSVAIKTCVVYSDQQWMRLKHMLCSLYDAAEDKYNDLLVDGVWPPVLASLRFICDACTRHRNELQVLSVDKGATMSFTLRLELHSSNSKAILKPDNIN